MGTKSSSEDLAEARERRAVIQPLAPPAAERFVVEPPRARIKKRDACLSQGEAVARHAVIMTAQDKLSTIARMDPPFASKLAELSNEIEAGAERWYEEIDTRFHNICELEKSIRGRALTLVSVIEKQRLFDEAKTMLDSPASLELDGGALLVLQARMKHLPSVIEEEVATVKELEAQARRLSTELGVPIPLMIADLRRRRCDASGRVVDSEIQSCAAHLDIP